MMEPKGSNGDGGAQPSTGTGAVQPASSCPVCGENEVKTTWIIHDFDYGSADGTAELHAKVPLHQCGACGFEFLDDTAERQKHIAICNHLGVLAPDEIRKIREVHGMTRAAFSRMTGLGEASLHRWEKGLSIQSHANDRYLRLLARPENISALQGFSFDGSPATAVNLSR